MTHPNRNNFPGLEFTLEHHGKTRNQVIFFQNLELIFQIDLFEVPLILIYDIFDKYLHIFIPKPLHF
jgi:hypothetical protein